MCLDGFVLVGSRTAYCDGEKWSTQLGFCRRSNHTKDHSCDFETEDLCGWEAEESVWLSWKRISVVADFHDVRTGPRYDHTIGNSSGGHYMLMESRYQSNGYYHLVSPIYPKSLCLKNACCFRFHYFMFGAGVDRLVVSVKPVSMRIENMWNSTKKFEVTGSQGTHWLEQTITIDKMQEDFQVVFMAKDARYQFGDIAIDDVKLMTGRECEVGGYTTTTESPPSQITSSEEPFVYDMMSCTGRCGSKSPGSPLFSDEGIIMGCGCHDYCLRDDNCCPNYFEECVKELDIAPDEDLSSRKSTTSSPRPTATSLRVGTVSTKTTIQSSKTPTTTTTSTTPRTTSILTTPEATSTKKFNATLTGKTSTKMVFAKTTTQTTTTTLIRKQIAETASYNRTTDVDLQGHMDISNGIPSPALIVLYLLVGVVLVLVLANVKQGCNILFKRSMPNEKVVSFKKAFGTVKKSRGSSQNRDSMDQHLCDTSTEDLDYEDI
nr:MAM and LDL-receptor class A domain-containing protein 2 isoform X2 [Drosophila suzukii]